MSLLCSSTPPRQLHLSTLFFSTPFLTDVSTPLDTSICRELLRIYIYALCDPVLISSISLDLSAPVHLLNHYLSLQTSFPSDFQAFSRFSLHLVCLFSLIYMHFMFWNLGFGVFWKILGFFKINELLLKFWDGFFKIIMHLDVCKFIVCWYVWIGLSPWCNLFCISHVHASPCIRTPFSIYLLYLNCLELFWLFLSSPSPSYLR